MKPSQARIHARQEQFDLPVSVEREIRDDKLSAIAIGMLDRVVCTAVRSAWRFRACRCRAIQYLVVARKGLPAKDLRDLIAFLKANPEHVTLGTAGLGSMLAPRIS